MCSGSVSGGVSVWDIRRSGCLLQSKLSSGVYGLSYDTPAEHIVAITDEGNVHVLNANTAKLM